MAPAGVEVSAIEQSGSFRVTILARGRGREEGEGSEEQAAPAMPSGYHSIMTRLLLTWIGVAALQLGLPSAAGLAEPLRPGGEPSSVAPRPEAQSKAALTREGSRIDVVRVAHLSPGAPAEPPHLSRASAHDTSPAVAPRRSGPASLPRVLPDARAPPA